MNMTTLARDIQAEHGAVIIACRPAQTGKTRRYDIGECVTWLWSAPVDDVWQVIGFASAADYAAQADTIKRLMGRRPKARPDDTLFYRLRRVAESDMERDRR